MKRAYLTYFGYQLGYQDKSWAPHKVCFVCTEHLRQWTRGHRKGMSFGVPMIWREQNKHANDCYSCHFSAETMLENFRILGVNVSIKVHFLHSHFPIFLKILEISVTNKERDFTKISKIWKIDIKVAGMHK